MVEPTDTEATSTNPGPIPHPADDLFYVLERPKYRSLLPLWEKAFERIYIDPQGANTAARTLLESTCYFILKEEGNNNRYENILALYLETSKTINIHPSKSESDSAKKLLGAVQTIFQHPIDIRRMFGDAHGGMLPSNSSIAQLSVNISGSISLFIIQSYESFLLYTKKLDENGKIHLAFDILTVHRLLDHARNSLEHHEWYGSQVGACLYLTGDLGVYLSSSGKPSLLEDGSVLRVELEKPPFKRLVAFADGCDPSASPFEVWQSIRYAINEGSDFSFPIPIEEFEYVIGKCNNYIKIIIDKESYFIVSD